MGNTHQKSHAAAGGTDYPTPKQLKEFWTQVACGRITKESFQEFLLGGCVNVPGMNPRRVARLTRDWGSLFPGKGHTVMEVLRPFYSPRYNWTLKPADKWVREKLDQIIFWHEANDVAFVTPDKLPRALEAPNREMRWVAGNPQALPYECNLGIALSQRFHDTIKEQLTPPQYGNLCSDMSLWNQQYGARITDRLAKNIDEGNANILRKHVYQEWCYTDRPGAYMPGDVNWHSLHTCFKNTLLDGLHKSLVYATAFRVLKDDTKDFRPLLELWRSGNLPLGFCKQTHRLIVLCASK